MMQVSMRRLPRSLAAAYRGLALAPKRLPLDVGLLRALLGATDDAITAFRRALVICPDDGLCSLHLASALVEKSQPEEALKTIHKSNCREWPEALLVAARAHLALGNEEAAQEIVDDLVARDPSYTEAGELLEAMSHEPG